MANQNPLHATFFAWRKREPGGVLTRLCVALVVIGFVFAAAYVLVSAATGWGPEMVAAMQGSMAGIGPSFPVTPASVGVTILIGLVFGLAFAILGASFEAACLRWMIHGEQGGGLFGLRLGADTWRVFGGYWMWLILIVVGYIGVIIVAIIAGFVVSLALPAGPSRGIGIIGVAIAAPVAMIYCLVRLAPAAAASIALRRFSFFSGWTISKGRFWALFGSYFLLDLLYLMASFAILCAYFSVMGLPLDGTQFFANPAAFQETYISAIARMWATPQGIAIMLALNAVGWLLLLLFATLGYGVTARAAIAAIEDGKITPGEALNLPG